MITALRATLSEEAIRWLDGVAALTADGPQYPPLLGSGGNDGNLEFSNNFMQRLNEVISEAPEGCEKPLRSSLFSTPSAALKKAAMGQFSPGTAGGLNTGVGIYAEKYLNPWDYILAVEGALVFAAAAVRRHAQDHTAALAFPFTTRTVGAGSGATALVDEKYSRKEFWAPLWSRAIGLEEMLLLMSEGRAVLNGAAARDGLDFARATAQLGVARGIRTFQRYSFLKRAGRAHFATSLGRVPVRENRRASLVSELDADAWLSHARQTVRDKNASASLAMVGRRFDDALFRLVGDHSTEGAQAALITIGALMLEVARRPKIRNTGESAISLLPPRLSEDWARAADDGSHEFALAAALASLDGPPETCFLPFRRHLAPLKFKCRDCWSDETEAQALVVWSGRDLIRDMGLVLERRLIEGQRHKFVDHNKQPVLPLSGWRTAPLAAVAAFLAGRTDDNRIAALCAGLAWARSPVGPSFTVEREDALSFSFAALKPLFAPEGVGPTAEKKMHPDLLMLIRLIKSGRIADAVMRAQAMARAAALPTPFARRLTASALDPGRLAAALLFPIAPKAHERLIARAYPDQTKIEENDDAD